jgi:hypothetical protein
MSRFAKAALAACMLPLAAACNQYGDAGTGLGPAIAQVRVVNVAPSVSSVNLLLNGATLSANVGFPNASTFEDVVALQQHVVAVTNGGGATLGQVSLSPSRNAHYSLVVHGIAGSLNVSLLDDKHIAAPAGAAHVRFVHMVPLLDRLDMYLGQAADNVTGLTPIHSDLSFEFLTGYYQIPAGTYHFLATNHNTGDIRVNGGSRTFASTEVYTIYLIEAPGGGMPYSILVVKDNL